MGEETLQPAFYICFRINNDEGGILNRNRKSRSKDNKGALCDGITNFYHQFRLFSITISTLLLLSSGAGTIGLLFRGCGRQTARATAWGESSCDAGMP